MLKIRLQRVGRKHEPSFRLVLTDSKNSTKSGKYLENLGSYDSRRGEKSDFNTDRISYWMSKGAQVSDTVFNMLVDKKVISGKKINVLPLKKAIVKDVPVQENPPVSNPVIEDNNEGVVSEKVETAEPIVEEVKTEASLEEKVEVATETTQA